MVQRTQQKKNQTGGKKRILVALLKILVVSDDYSHSRVSVHEHEGGLSNPPHPPDRSAFKCTTGCKKGPMKRSIF